MDDDRCVYGLMDCRLIDGSMDRWIPLLAKLRKVRAFYAQLAISYHSSDRGVVFGPTYPSADHRLRLELELRYLLLEHGTIFPEGANSAVTILGYIRLAKQPPFESINSR